jgi:hypothetical protein
MLRMTLPGSDQSPVVSKSSPALPLGVCVQTSAGQRWILCLAAISCAVLSPRSASSATVALDLSEKLRLVVIPVSCRQCWIYLSTLPEFARRLQGAAGRCSRAPPFPRAAGPPFCQVLVSEIAQPPVLRSHHKPPSIQDRTIESCNTKLVNRTGKAKSDDVCIP